MKDWVLPYLLCPQCKGLLGNNIFERKNPAITWSGVLVCQNKNCSSWYPVIRGIPRLLAEQFRFELTQQFITEFSDDLGKLGIKRPEARESTDRLKDLKIETIKNFGFEWLEFDRFGWDDPVFNNEFEQGVFFS